MPTVWEPGSCALFKPSRDAEYLLSIAIDDEGHTADWLRRGRVVAAVTASAKPVQGCTVTSLGALRYAATASPDFVRRCFPNGVTAEAIARAPALTFTQKDLLQQDWVRRVFKHSVVFPTHWLPSTQAFVDASVEGLGWALNPVQFVQNHLASGQLDLVPGAYLERSLFWQVNRLSTNRLSPLTQAIKETARRKLTTAQGDPIA